ncbi:DUF2326 domain-containing protein [Faecalicatena fissicatena]|uniref:DUF2326 domain-containing protein n=1 Tax=Faecalicatena fissicatena TaxID=290055 RepID=A0ABX2GXB7_9FIRM|nr:DUF2326 domain-containing protein [Faecalicatena fissicatena]MCB5867816.1 DUF2326 domain-containing protein [Faecalicatena fissicatena]NSD82739.1 DUF2326 domain-containing protein [Faecalicatena fissicatena]NSE55303.1 DUF2326 domain-containing protein [Faecalicatena fissicatena]NSE64051.1 DUF2326 domain-containing protein [Faecalicatena fissicatena]NSG30177.1 DUF2326 domain-containing protein [Faecalicatena fissicatena]
MGKEIKRIRLNRLYSENNVFEEISFHDGVNIILGEKYDDSSVKGRKTNGVGKSMCIEFLDFCFLSDYDKSRVAKIPKEVFPLEENVILDLDIGAETIIIKRNREQADQPVIIRGGKTVSFDKLQDARDYLTGIIFSELNGKTVPSFRNLFSILMRDERSEFKDIIKCHDLTKKIPDDLTAHLFLLGFSLEAYKNTVETIKEIGKITTVLSKEKRELTQDGQKKISDVRAELNALEDELKKLEDAIESFKTNETFDSMEADLIELEELLDQLRKRQKALRHDYEKIRKMPKPEQIDDREIELVYNQFKSELGNAVVKSLNEVVGFKNKIEDFQRTLVNQKAKELESQLKSIAEQIRILDDEYSEKLKIIDKKGVLKNLKISLKIYEAKKESISRTKFLFEQYEKHEKKKRILNLQKTQQIMEIETEIEQNEEMMDSFMETILQIHEFIMGNRECSFSIQTIDKAQSKTPVELVLRIYDDGSRSVDRTKVFIYDMALLFNQYTRDRHPLFLVHDNIFDVDQDTLVRCLNYIYSQEEQYQDFQYILTLNRDKIENEEQRKLIRMDIDEHQVAVFTKEKKFLKRNYQEQ